MICKNSLKRSLSLIQENGGIGIEWFNQNHSMFDSLMEKRYIKLYTDILLNGDKKETLDDRMKKLISFSEKLYENRQIIKNSKLKTFLESYNFSKFELETETNKTFMEFVDDTVSAEIADTKMKSFFTKELGKESVFYKKYKSDLETIYNGGGKELLKDFFSKIKTINKMKDEEIYQKITDIKDLLFPLSKRMAELVDSELVFSDSEFDILSVGCFEDMKVMGSPAWCIWREKQYFDSYVEIPNMQYIVFNKQGEVLYGVTVDSDGKIGACFDKNDNVFHIADISEKLKEQLVPMKKEVMKERLIKTGTYSFENVSKCGLVDDVKLFLKDEEFNPGRGHNAAIRLASEYGRTDVVKTLLDDSRVNPGDGNNAALILSAESGYIDIVRLLLKDKRVDPNDGDSPSIRFASKAGQLEVVKLLLSDKRIDPAGDDNLALRWAVGRDRIEIVKLLLSDHRVDPHVRNDAIMKMSIEQSYFEMTKVILEDGRIDVHANNDEMIKFAEMYGNPQIINLLKSIPIHQN